jgi:DNA repair protein RadC
VRDAGRATGIWWFVRQDAGGWKRERLLIVVLDQQRQILGAGEVPPGAVTAAHLRRILKGIPLAQAAGLITIHNQPGTRRRPSRGDAAIVACLRQAAEEIGVPLLDHAIFRGGRFHSLLNNSKLL